VLGLAQRRFQERPLLAKRTFAKRADAIDAAARVFDHQTRLLEQRLEIVVSDRLTSFD
jgi:hypothetical protein